MKRKDIEQIIHNAYKYNDQEVINHLSKNQRIAAFWTDFENMAGGIGLQRSQTPTGAQFTSDKEFKNFMSGSAANVDTRAVEAIIKFWRETLKSYAVSSIPIPALKREEEFVKNPDGTFKKDTFGNYEKASIDKEYTYQFKPGAYIDKQKLEEIWNSIGSAPTSTPPPGSPPPVSKNYNKLYGLDPGATGFHLDIYEIGNNAPSSFEQVNTGASTIRFKSPSGASITDYDTKKEYIKIESGGVGAPGYIEKLKQKLATNFPKENNDNHAVILNEIGNAMSGASTGFWKPNGQKYFSSMLRQNSIGTDKIQGLASTWNYIVGLPELIQKRQGKPPGGVLEYKQKMILKNKGIELQNILNKKYEVTDSVGQKHYVRLADMNKLSKDYFDELMKNASGDLAAVGTCVAFIQQELDKDNSRVRKFLKDTDYNKDLFTTKSNIKF